MSCRFVHSLTRAEVDADVEADDDEDEDDVAHEPDVDLLEVGRLGEVLLDGGQERGQDEERGEGAHEPVGEDRGAKAAGGRAGARGASVEPQSFKTGKVLVFQMLLYDRFLWR